jgi:hypothetical protein
MSEQPVTPDVTPDRLAEIQQRADAATEGPWVAHWWGVESESVDVLVIQDDYESSRQDFEFIAHAREDIPFLLAELSRYQAAVQAAIRFVDQVAAGEHSFGPWPGMGDFFRAEMAQLIGSDAGWIAEHLGDER